jgi:hypothetical protein
LVSKWYWLVRRFERGLFYRRVWFHRGAVSKRFVLEECGLKEMWAREKVLGLNFGII